MKQILILIAALVFIGCGEKQEESKAKAPTPIKVQPQEEPMKVVERKVEEKKIEVVEKKQTPASVAATTSLSSKCVSCHGSKGEKKALGKSKEINTMNKAEILTALEGYQQGTYGGAMKALMKSQVVGLNKEQLEELADFFSKK